MKLPTIFLLLLIFGCKQSEQKIVEKYSEGQTKIKYIYPNRDDTSTYTCNVYYETGKLKHKTQVVSGMFVGNKLTYYENGNLEQIERLSHPTRLDDAEYDCHITNYRPDGTKKRDYIYKDDEINGLVTDYDSTGKIIRTAEYIDGKINGKETFYFSNSNVRNIAFIKDDTLIEVDIYFKENGDSLKWFRNGDYGLNGMFYKKWLPDGNILTGSYGDSLRSFVI